MIATIKDIEHLTLQDCVEFFEAGISVRVDEGREVTFNTDGE